MCNDSFDQDLELSKNNFWPKKLKLLQVQDHSTLSGLDSSGHDLSNSHQTDYIDSKS